MQDDLSGFKPLDPGRVNAVDPVEVKYWCKELKCTEDQLAKAVAKVGEHVAEVRQFLNSSDRPR
jgi:Protein of unknown function (DUF3606)